MSVNWLKNMVGIRLTEEQMKDIPNPTVELTVHVTAKNIQAFALLGTVVVGPVRAIARAPTRNLSGIISTATKFGKYGVVIGCFLGPAMTYGRLKSSNATHDAIYDRCYRLRNNRSQIRVDQASVVGAIGGAGLLTLVFRKCPIFGALFGMSSGIIAMAIYNNKAPSK